MLFEVGDRGPELLTGSAFSEEVLFEEVLAEWFGFDMFFRVSRGRDLKDDGESEEFLIRKVWSLR
jgi:hypothetical protein